MTWRWLHILIRLKTLLVMGEKEQRQLDRNRTATFDRIPFSWASTMSIKQQHTELAFISKINKLSEDLARHSTALHCNTLSLNSSSSSVSSPTLLSFPRYSCLNTSSVFPVKDWGGKFCTDCTLELVISLAYRVRRWLLYRTSSKLNPLCFEVLETQEQEEKQKMRTNR